MWSFGQNTEESETRLLSKSERLKVIITRVYLTK